jgi:hypothetical protein
MAFSWQAPRQVHLISMTHSLKADLPPHALSLLSGE